MPTHSIIIPHRNRNTHLECAVLFLRRSAARCQANDYEIVVVDGNSKLLPPSADDIKVVHDPQDGPVYNKPRAQNLGIEAAGGSILTFLDADILVGKRWFALQRYLADPSLTKLCYRVRNLPIGISQAADARSMDWLGSVDACWLDYHNSHRHRLRHEGRVKPELDQAVGEPLFGNSQFSITRDKLGDLRFCEDFAGAGWEDIWMNREIWRRWGDEYRATMPTLRYHCLFHISHERKAPGWCSEHTVASNYQRYTET